MAVCKGSQSGAAGAEEDADLIGGPVRITVGDKALDEGCVEVKARSAGKAELVAVDQAVGVVCGLLEGG